MFLDFAIKWLKYRYVKQTQEVRTFHAGELPEIPEGYYLVIDVQLKPVDLATELFKQEVVVA